MLEATFRPLEIDAASIVYSAYEEVGYGGHFFGAAHTLERFRDCFYRPLLSSTENFERWQKRGGQDAVERAARIWQESLERYEEPPLDPATREQLEEFVTRRRV